MVLFYFAAVLARLNVKLVVHYVTSRLQMINISIHIPNILILLAVLPPKIMP